MLYKLSGTREYKMSTELSVLVPNLVVYILTIRSGLNKTFVCCKSFSFSINNTYQILTIKEYKHIHTHKKTAAN